MPGKHIRGSKKIKQEEDNRKKANSLGKRLEKKPKKK